MILNSKQILPLPTIFENVSIRKFIRFCSIFVQILMNFPTIKYQILNISEFYSQRITSHFHVVTSEWWLASTWIIFVTKYHKIWTKSLIVPSQICCELYLPRTSLLSSPVKHIWHPSSTVPFTPIYSVNRSKKVESEQKHRADFIWDLRVAHYYPCRG